MTDPYKVLGITPQATDEEVKKAYRKQSRIYHPDANINNANKDQAEEKFKEVQEAYKQIMHEREYGYSNSGQGSYGNSGGYGSYDDFGGFGGFGSFGGFGGFGGYNSQNSSSSGSQETIELNAAQNYINNRCYNEALNVLNNISSRTARWYYLHSIANSGLGNNISALEDARKAVQLDPSNMLYRQLLSSLESGGQWYQHQETSYGGRPRNASSNCCWEFLCLNLICNCCCNGFRRI